MNTPRISRVFEMLRSARQSGKGASPAVVAGGAVLFLSSALVNGGNYLFNLILGRWLGPEEFSDLSLIVTLLLLLSFATSTLSMVGARFVAMRAASDDEAGIARYRDWLGRLSLITGLVLGVVLVAGATTLQSFFKTGSAWPFVLLGIGIPLYLLQGVERGVLQGRTRFVRLSASYQAEMWTRLLGGIVMVALGFGVSGAVGAIAASFFATWWIARAANVNLKADRALREDEKRAVATFAGPVLLGLAGQILVNNSDVLIVKRVFSAESAGQYAALALVGRIVFFAAWPIATVIFPLAAQRAEKGEGHRQLLAVSMGVSLAIGAVITTACAIMPNFIVRVLFGSEYLPIASLLWMYALATTAYTVASTVIEYHLALGQAFGSLLALGAGILQIVLLILFHDSLRQVVMVQLYLMAGLVAATLLWSFMMRNAPVRRGHG